MNLTFHRALRHCGLCALFLLTASACKPSSSEQMTDKNSEPDAAAKPRIALIMKSLANEFFSTMAEGAKAHQAAHADRYELVVNGIKDERDLSRQVALVDEMVSSGIDAIVIAPANSQALVPVLKRAKAAGVVVINIDNRLDAGVLAEEGVSIPFVGPDNKAGAKKVAAHLAAGLQPGDAVAILEGIRTSFNGQQRRLGFEQALKEAGVDLVASQSAEWEMSRANAIASSMLSEHPQLKAILACNDSMALGAVAAVRGAGREEQVQIVGFDNISAVQQAIRDGRILATADQHGNQLAVFGIEHALQLLDDANAKVEDRETPVDLVRKEDLK